MILGSSLGNFLGDTVQDIIINRLISVGSNNSTYTWTFTNPLGTIGNHSIKDGSNIVYGNSPQIFNNVDTNNAFVSFYPKELVGPLRNSSGGLELERVDYTTIDTPYVFKRKFAEPFFRNSFVGGSLKFSGNAFRNGHSI